MKIGIIGSTTALPLEFMARYQAKIADYMGNVSTQFFFTDESGIAMHTAKYLNGRGFRNCTIYHVGTICRHDIGKYKKRSGYSNVAEARDAIIKECDMLLG
jgi:hypothetical protein